MPTDAGPPPVPVAPAETANEVVSRPAPGTLARGMWEAPAWAFYVAAALVIVAAALYVASRAGLLRRKPGPR